MAMIDMQTMRYINLLDKVARVKTSKCFVYNNVIIFAVPSALLSRTIGPGGRNVRELQHQLGKRVKVIKEANGLSDAERFVEDIVEPVGFVSFEIKEDEIIITAGSQNKAALLGRNKRRLIELAQIVEDNFDKELRIV
jgi:transcription antitermination factor NusA-like protein